MNINCIWKLFETRAPTFLALIILVTGGVVCMAVVSLLKLEQFFLSKEQTSILLEKEWLQFLFSQAL